MSSILSIKDKRFIADNYLRMSGTDMAKSLCVSKEVIYYQMRKAGLTVPKTLKQKFKGDANRKPFTPEEDAYIRGNIEQMSLKAMAKVMHRTSWYVSDRTKELGFGNFIEQRRKDSLIRTGTVPFNKGRKMDDYLPAETINKIKKTAFKKGHLPVNTKYDGAITIRYSNEEPSKYIRISQAEWMPLHQYLWEQKHGKYDGNKQCLWFKNGDSMNCDLDNLELITREENLRRNVNSLPPAILQVKKLNTRLKNAIDEHRTENSTAAQ